MTSINQIYAWYMPRFLCFSIHCVFTEQIITKLPRLVWTNMYICILMRGTPHNPLKCMVYWAVIYDRYMSGICMSYIFNWNLPLQLAAYWHFWSSKHAGPLQTWTYCESNRSWRPKGHPLQAGACQRQPGVDLINMAAPAWSLVCSSAWWLVWCAQRKVQ